jgi:hypothetical protein
MNNIFSLPMTGAMARRLLAIAKVVDIDLDALVHVIAKQDLIDDDPIFARSAKTQEILQFIIDHDFRCCIVAKSKTQTYDATETYDAILTAINMKNIKNISFYPVISEKWRNALKKFNFNIWSTIEETEIAQRDGVLILNWDEIQTGNDKATQIQYITQQFSKTIIISYNKYDPKPALTLFPNMIELWSNATGWNTYFIVFI